VSHNNKLCKLSLGESFRGNKHAINANFLRGKTGQMLPCLKFKTEASFELNFVMVRKKSDRAAPCNFLNRVKFGIVEI